MTGVARDRRRGAAPRGLLGMLALVFMIEGSLDRRAADFTPWGTWAWRHSGAMLGRKAPGSEVLCFGDSLIKFGVVPRVLEERRARRGLQPGRLQRPGGLELLPAPAGAGGRRAGRRPWSSTSPRTCSPRGPCTTPPVARAGGPRRVARAGLVGASRGVLRPAHAGVPAPLGPGPRGDPGGRSGPRCGARTARNARRSGPMSPTGVATSGRTPTPGGPPTGARSTPRTRVVLPRAWRCHPVNEAYLRRFLALADGHAIPVFWLLPPIAPVVQARRERTGADAGTTRFVRRDAWPTSPT